MADLVQRDITRLYDMVHESFSPGSFAVVAETAGSGKGIPYLKNYVHLNSNAAYDLTAQTRSCRHLQSSRPLV